MPFNRAGLFIVLQVDRKLAFMRAIPSAFIALCSLILINKV